MSYGLALTKARRVTVTHKAIGPLDEARDHVRGPANARLVVEYGDYQCPYSRAAYRLIERIERQLNERIRFAFRHFR